MFQGIRRGPCGLRACRCPDSLLDPNNILSCKYLVSHPSPWEGIYPLPFSSPGPWLGTLLANQPPSQTSLTCRISWELALGAYKPAKISQHKVNLSPDILKNPPLNLPRFGLEMLPFLAQLRPDLGPVWPPRCWI